MNATHDFNPQSFAVVGAGPVGCIVAAFLSKAGYKVTLCDVLPELVTPALKDGIVVEGVETIQQTVAKTCTSVDDLADDIPDRSIDHALVDGVVTVVRTGLLDQAGTIVTLMRRARGHSIDPTLAPRYACRAISQCRIGATLLLDDNSRLGSNLRW